MQSSKIENDILSFIDDTSMFLDTVGPILQRESLSAVITDIESLINEGDLYMVELARDHQFIILQKTYDHLPPRYQKYCQKIARSDDTRYFPRSRFIGSVTSPDNEEHEWSELYPMWCCTIGSYIRRKIKDKYVKYTLIARLFPAEIPMNLMSTDVTVTVGNKDVVVNAFDDNKNLKVHFLNKNNLRNRSNESISEQVVDRYFSFVADRVREIITSTDNEEALNVVTKIARIDIRKWFDMFDNDPIVSSVMNAAMQRASEEEISDVLFQRILITPGESFFENGDRHLAFDGEESLLYQELE